MLLVNQEEKYFSALFNTYPDLKLVTMYFNEDVDESLIDVIGIIVEDYKGGSVQPNPISLLTHILTDTSISDLEIEFIKQVYSMGWVDDAFVKAYRPGRVYLEKIQQLFSEEIDRWRVRQAAL